MMLRLVPFVIALLAALPAQAADRWLTTSDGIRLHYTDTGPMRSGRTLVLVPGWTMPGWIFDRQIADLSRDYRVIAFDPRGQGQSDIAFDGYEPGRRGEDIADLLQAIGPERPVVVGWSLGVLDTLAYVHTHGGQRIAGLVLIDNSVGEDPAPTPSPAGPRPRHREAPVSREVSVRRFVRGMFDRTPDAGYLERLSEAALRTPAVFAARLLAYPVPRTYWRDALYAAGVPVLYVVRPRLAGQAGNLAAHDPEAESVVMQGVGHALFVDDAPRFDALVRDFLRRRVWLALTVFRLLPLFLVSACTLGFEVALTRYFAVAKWSEYGYWVISIVLAGFALSGVLMALARPWFARRAVPLLSILPIVMIVAGAAGYAATAANPFNPLALQNSVTLVPQLWLIGGYYLCLLPFFFAGGLFVSLSFVHLPRPGRVYAADLIGAGAGTLLVLGLMYVVHPFRLIAYLLPLLFLATAAQPWRRFGMAFLALLVLGPCLNLVLRPDLAGFSEYKAIYPPLHVPDSRVVRETLSPRGLYDLLDDFTERVDPDVSPDAASLGLPGPPRTLGLYRDGGRIAAIPNGALDVAYAPATLSALPYAMLSHPRVLLAGGSAGFRVAEARALGASAIDVSEPEPFLRATLTAAADLRIHRDGPLTLARQNPEKFDLVDISGDFLDSAEGNSVAFGVEALAADLRAVRPSGIVSIPVSIRELPAYALRMLATARAALLATGITDPESHVLAIRSAWNVRILISPVPFDAARIAVAKTFAGPRSFDLSYYPGIDPEAARAGIFNDLPAVSFSEGTVTSRADTLHDAITDEAESVLLGHATQSGTAFDLSPITLDRPAFYDLLKITPAALPTIVDRLELLPQAEVAPLVNLAVLAQAAIIALIVLIVPLFGGRRVRPTGGGTVRAVVYFAALGLGFFAIEIFAIEQASVLFADRTLAFALVLTAMLVFSGLGSLLADRWESRARRAAAIGAGCVVLWCALASVGATPALLATLGWPLPVRVAAMLAVLAPVSVALGLLFPLGLARSGEGFLPWAWALNGAFSVVATPLANLIALNSGYRWLIQLALVMYAVAIITFPRARILSPWTTRSLPVAP